MVKHPVVTDSQAGQRSVPARKAFWKNTEAVGEDDFSKETARPGLACGKGHGAIFAKNRNGPDVFSFGLPK